MNKVKIKDIDSEITEEDCPFIKLNKLLVKNIKEANDVDRLETDMKLTIPDASYFITRLDEDLGVQANIQVNLKPEKRILTNFIKFNFYRLTISTILTTTE